MSVSNIIGDTSNDNDAKKVRWANIVCNSIYSLNGFNGKDINVENIDAISIDTEDLKATNIIVTNINGKPPASVKNSSSLGSSLVSEPNPSDYEVRRLQSGVGISLVESPGAIEINSTANTYSLAAARFGIDPSSNPGPIIGGLLFDPTLTTAGTFAIPLMSTPIGLGIGDNFLDDADNYFTLTSPTTIQINVSGKYHLSLNLLVLSNDTLTTGTAQILRSTDSLFTAPPAMSDFTNLVSTGLAPISAIYANAYSLTCSIDSVLTAGDIFGVKIYFEGGSGGDTAEISLTSALSIHLIGGTSSGAGSSGVTAVNSLGTGETLLNPSGAGPVLGVKSLVAGTGIVFTPNADEIQIDATASGITAVNSLGTGETLLNPSGTGPTIAVKSLIAGANVTLTPTGNDITISSAGSLSSWNVGGNAGLVGPTEIFGSTPSGGQMLVSTTGNQFSVIGGEVSGSNMTFGSLSIKSFRDTAPGSVTLPTWSTGLYIKDITTFSTLQLPPVSVNFNDPARILVCTANITTTAPPTGTGTVISPNASDRLLIQNISGTTPYRLPPNGAAMFVECPGFGHWATFGQTPSLYFREGYFPLTPDNVTVPDWWLSNNTASYSVNYLDGCSFQVPGNGAFNSQNTSPRLKLESVRFSFDSPNVSPNGWTLRIYTDTSAFPAVAPTNLIFTGTFTNSSSGITWGLNSTVQPTFINYFFRITNIGTGITPRRCKWTITGSMPQ